MGPIQKFVRIRVNAAKRARRNGIMEVQALPNATGGASSIQNSMGNLGI
jgi:hypothetical protein